MYIELEEPQLSVRAERGCVQDPFCSSGCRKGVEGDVGKEQLTAEG